MNNIASDLLTYYLHYLIGCLTLGIPAPKEQAIMCMYSFEYCTLCTRMGWKNDITRMDRRRVCVYAILRISAAPPRFPDKLIDRSAVNAVLCAVSNAMLRAYIPVTSNDTDSIHTQAAAHKFWPPRYIDCVI